MKSRRKTEKRSFFIFQTEFNQCEKTERKGRKEIGLRSASGRLRSWGEVLRGWVAWLGCSNPNVNQQRLV